MTGQAVVVRPTPLEARRLVFSAEELTVLGAVLPGELPAPVMPSLAAVSSSDGIVDGLVERGVLVRLADEVDPPAGQQPFEDARGHRYVVPTSLAWSWALLAGAPLAIDLTVRGPDPSTAPGTRLIGQRAWVSLRGPTGASLRRLDDDRLELTAFLANGLADELGSLIPNPEAFTPPERVSIADALTGSGSKSGTPGDATDVVGPLTVRADSADGKAVGGRSVSSLLATVMVRTRRGPAAGTLSWLGTADAWWQVDADWRRWQRSGERQMVLTRVVDGEAGPALKAQVRRLLAAAQSMNLPGEVSDGER